MVVDVASSFTLLMTFKLKKMPIRAVFAKSLVPKTYGHFGETTFYNNKNKTQFWSIKLSKPNKADKYLHRT